MKIFLTLTFSLVLAGCSLAQKASDFRGTFAVSGTGSYDATLALSTFVSLLPGGPNRTVIFIPTASSGIKLPNGHVYIPPKRDTTEAYTRSFESELEKLFKVDHIKILHTRDKAVANGDEFIQVIRNASGVWISGGNAGRLADAYLKTKTQAELKDLVNRGGVIGGNSAGAIILGSYIVRGWTEKPILMARGHDKGFDLIKGVAFNPHLLTAKREYELMSVVHEYPHLLGIGIDDYAVVVITDNIMQHFGKGKVALYDNQKHGDKWYYWLGEGQRFDLQVRKIIP
jgi:cyanophycinase